MKKGGKFKGIIPAVVTPFTKSGTIDEKLFVNELRRMIDNGVHGLSIGGSTGEGAFLADAELSRLLTIARREAKTLPLVAGIIRPGVNMVIDSAKVARDAGADVLMITPTYYNVLVPDEDGNYLFYDAVSKAVDLPIIIYNVVNQNEVTVEQFTRLLKIKNVMGVKQSLGGVLNNYDMVLTNGKKGMIYCAADAMTFTCFDFGCDGAISAITSLAPGLCVDMWECALAGKTKEGLAIQNRIFPLMKAMLGPQFPAKLKFVLTELGHKAGMTRLPLHELSPDVKKRLKKSLDATGRDWIR